MGSSAINAYCRDKAAPEGSSIHYASLFHPDSERRALLALFALYFELLESVTAASDPGVIRIRLQWWREELARLQQGQPRHPVAEELQRLQQAELLDPSPLADLPTALEGLFAPAPGRVAEDWPEAGSLADFWIAAASVNQRPQAAEARAAADTGIAISRLEILQNLRHLGRLGFNPLPLGALKRHNVHDADLQATAESPAVLNLATELLDEIENDLQEAFSRFPRQSVRRQPFAPIMNRIARTTCREIRRDGCRLLTRRVALTPIRKFRIAVSTRYFGRLF